MASNYPYPLGYLRKIAQGRTKAIPKWVAKELFRDGFITSSIPTNGQLELDDKGETLLHNNP